MWINHDNFKDFVKEKWLSYQGTSPKMLIFASKLRMLKADLKLWNREIFGNIHERFETASCNLEDIQIKIAKDGPSKELFNQEIKAHTDLMSAMDS